MYLIFFLCSILHTRYVRGVWVIGGEIIGGFRVHSSSVQIDIYTKAKWIYYVQCHKRLVRQPGSCWTRPTHRKDKEEKETVDKWQNREANNGVTRIKRNEMQTICKWDANHEWPMWWKHGWPSRLGDELAFSRKGRAVYNGCGLYIMLPNDG